MSLVLYDNALKLKLEDVFPNVVIAPPDEAFNRSEKDGKVKLPLISAYRLSNPVDWEDYNHYESFIGRGLSKSSDSDIDLHMQGIPITITYQIDIWAQLREYADGIYRELIYYLLRKPNLTIIIPGFTKPLDFAMTLTDVDTSTDYASFEDKHLIHRYTLTYEVPRARMFFESDSNKLVRDIKVQLVTVEQTEGDGD